MKQRGVHEAICVSGLSGGLLAAGVCCALAWSATSAQAAVAYGVGRTDVAATQINPTPGSSVPEPVYITPVPVYYFDAEAYTGVWADPWHYVLPSSSECLLTDADVQYMGPYLLYLARNEIYARHGYIFENADLVAYFGGKSWYAPRYAASAFDESCLSYTEQRNIGLIIKWENAWKATGVTVDAIAWSYVLPASDTRLLTDADLCSLTSYELYLARNEIYARHGYIFSNADLASYFSGKAWYVPRYTASTFDESCLSYTEQRNVALILEYEQGFAGRG